MTRSDRARKGPLTRARSRIRRYLDHLQDRAYVEAVFALVDVAALDGLLADMLRSGGREDAHLANLFVRDAVLFGFSPAFRERLPRSRTLRALRENLYASDYTKRHLSAYALGKLCLPANARYVAAAFPWYLQHDPLNLDGLLFELCWLRRRAPREQLLEAIATAPLYLTRWAAVYILWMRELGLGTTFPDLRTAARAGSLLERLAQDDHPWVRGEAAWCLEQVVAARQSWRPNQPWHAPSRPVRGTVLTFDEIHQNVGNYLAICDQADYDVALVERIAAYLREHPITAGYDAHAYWREFTASG